MSPYLKLIRPVNLLIIALTMYAVRFFYINLSNYNVDANFNILHEQIDFFLLVFSTITIAAGGNIINDYFDVKADRINKPEKLIISKSIRRRSAIMSHWVLNSFAFAISLYLSIRYKTLWYVFIHLLSINSLWFYSMYFKRRALVGNLIIAMLTALVPILCGIHFYIVGSMPDLQIAKLNEAMKVFPAWVNFLAEHGRFVFGIAFFAFILNFAREIIKDMQDVKGDLELSARTLAIQLGEKKSSKLVALILVVLPISFLVMYFLKVEVFIQDIVFFVPFVISLLLMLFVSFTLVIKHSKRSLKFYDNVLKVSMLLGVILPFYWYLLL